MLEFTLTGNLGKDPRVYNDIASTTICCNTPVNNTPGASEPVWIDIQSARHNRNGERLLSLYKGDGVFVRGMVRINHYEHNGKPRQGWTLIINQLHVMHRGRGND